MVVTVVRGVVAEVVVVVPLARRSEKSTQDCREAIVVPTKTPSMSVCVGVRSGERPSRANISLIG